MRISSFCVEAGVCGSPVRCRRRRRRPRRRFQLLYTPTSSPYTRTYRVYLGTCDLSWFVHVNQGLPKMLRTTFPSVAVILFALRIRNSIKCRMNLSAEDYREISLRKRTRKFPKWVTLLIRFIPIMVCNTNVKKKKLSNQHSSWLIRLYHVSHVIKRKVSHTSSSRIR